MDAQISAGVGGVYLNFDLDVLDPTKATPINGRPQVD
jgi:arginase family enzyme